MVGAEDTSMARSSDTKPAGPGASTKGRARTPPRRRVGPLRWLWRRLRWLVFGPVLAVLAVVLLYRWVNPPLTHTMWAEARRLGGIERSWVPLAEIGTALPRAVVAAEDANFCLHWGFDVEAIKAALEDGAQRGASTITQQTVKNVFLWQDRSWLRKALEALLTPVVEAAWPKARILEVYLNVAEFDEGVFGVDAAALHYFGVGPTRLSEAQAARLATVLPSPKTRAPESLGPNLRRRAATIADGAATIARDGRAACFES